jgi:NADPH:quinone reductase-like Zn-dependent oxidoreductase
MKAILCERYGPPETLRLNEVEKPAVKDAEVLVRVHAASVNPLDWHLVRGAPIIARMSVGLLKPKDPRIGVDGAGRVEAVGNSVTHFKPGDEVFGFCKGSFAEYAVAQEDRLASKPANVSFEAAAAVPIAGITALQGLRDQGRIKSGQKVLINGASGGVGTFAVQIAKAFGAEVTGVCSTRNLDFVRSLGADYVIDYTKEDFTQGSQSYDLILDAVGTLSVSAGKRILNPQGNGVVVGFSGMFRLMRLAIRGRLTSKTASRKVGMMGARQTGADLAVLKELIEAGKVVPVIERRYALTAVPEALGYLEAGHARGKVVINCV